MAGGLRARHRRGVAHGDDASHPAWRVLGGRPGGSPGRADPTAAGIPPAAGAAGRVDHGRPRGQRRPAVPAAHGHSRCRAGGGRLLQRVPHALPPARGPHRYPRASLLSRLGVQGATSPWPNELWIRFPSSAGAAVNNHVSADSTLLASSLRADAESAALADPLRVGIHDELVLGFVVALAVVVVGFGLHFLAAARNRATEYAIMRANGVPQAALRRSLAAEQLVVLITGVASGTVIGLALAWAVLPIFHLGALPEDVTPPSVFHVDPLTLRRWCSERLWCAGDGTAGRGVGVASGRDVDSAVTGMTAPIVECEGLVHIYKAATLEVVALQGLDLQVEAGEMVAIAGRSGSGKTTLMNILAGLERPSAGMARVGGHDLTRLSRPNRSATGVTWPGTCCSTRAQTLRRTSPRGRTFRLRWRRARRVVEQVVAGTSWNVSAWVTGSRTARTSPGRSREPALRPGHGARQPILACCSPMNPPQSWTRLGRRTSSRTSPRAPRGGHRGRHRHPRPAARGVRRPRGHDPRRSHQQ